MPEFLAASGVAGISEFDLAARFDRTRLLQQRTHAAAMNARDVEQYA
jgi:hypothetical protein